MTVTRYCILTGLAALAVAVAVHPAAAQRDRDRDRSRDEYATRLDTTVALDRDGLVELAITSGSIIVTGWDRGEVRVRAFSERGTIDFAATSSRVALDARPRGGRMGDTHYEITMPVGARLQMRSISGELSARGVRGEVDARSTSGEIEIADVTRAMAATVSGSVRMLRVEGNVRVSTISGEVELQRVTGDVEAGTVSGEIAVSEARSRYVRAQTTSGSISFDGTVDPAGRYQFGSHSGSVHLTLPDSVGATLGVETFSGEIDSDFPMTLMPGERLSSTHGRRFEFKLGDGRARISAGTFSGEIQIERGGGRAKREE
ncbi:MAG: DUF4097 family beta strand repeat-containing protein [Gemmatimonadaceae bacterium]